MLCNQELPPAEGNDAVPMSQLQAFAEMEVKTESAIQVLLVSKHLIA